MKLADVVIGELYTTGRGGMPIVVQAIDFQRVRSRHPSGRQLLRVKLKVVQGNGFFKTGQLLWRPAGMLNRVKST